MRIDTKLDQVISTNIKQANKLERENHVSSGKLSASILGWPLQWQVLKYLQVPPKPFDDYTLRMFLRGKHVEDFVVSNMKGAKPQVEVNYRGCTGFLDVLWENEPHEVKSVKNSKYTRIVKAREADDQHKLQGCYYAMGLKYGIYYIDYVAADDYRVTSFCYETDEKKDEVDRIIDEYEEAIEKRVLPAFIPRYKWQANSMYCTYPDFMSVSGLSFDEFESNKK